MPVHEGNQSIAWMWVNCSGNQNFAMVALELLTLAENKIKLAFTDLMHASTISLCGEKKSGEEHWLFNTATHAG